MIETIDGGEMLLSKDQATEEKREEESMGHHDGDRDAYIKPGYTALEPMEASLPNEFTSALPVFLASNPEFAHSSSKMEVLQYCFKFYVNYDPELRDLPILERLAHAGRMANDFFGTMNGVKV